MDMDKRNGRLGRIGVVAAAMALLAGAEARAADLNIPSKVLPINRQQFDIDYTLSAPASEVALWYTEDGGKNWQLYGLDSDARSPVGFTARHEGLYGFKVIARNKKGASEPNPQPGTPPSFWCFMDWTAPQVQVTAPAPTMPLSGQAVGQIFLKEHEPLVINYTAVDDYLVDRSISISYRLLDETNWQAIGAELRNTGQFIWNAPATLTRPFILRVMASDRVRNTGVGTSKEMMIRWVQEALTPEEAIPVGPSRLVTAPTTAPETTITARAPAPAPASPAPLPSERDLGAAPKPEPFTVSTGRVEPQVTPPAPTRAAPREIKFEPPTVSSPPPMEKAPAARPDAALDAILEQDALGVLVLEFTAGQPVRAAEFDSTLKQLSECMEQLADRNLTLRPIGTALQGPPGMKGMVKSGRLYAIIPEARRNKEDAGAMVKFLEEQLGHHPNVVVRTRFEKTVSASATARSDLPPPWHGRPSESVGDELPRAAGAAADEPTIAVTGRTAEPPASSRRPTGPADQGPTELAIEIGDKPAHLEAIRPAVTPPIPTGPTVVAANPPYPLEPVVAGLRAGLPAVAEMSLGGLPVAAGGADSIVVGPSQAGVSIVAPTRSPTDIELPHDRVAPASPARRPVIETPAVSPAMQAAAQEDYQQALRLQATDPTRARALYVQALKKNPVLVEAMVNLAGLLLKQNDLPGAEVYYRQALGVDAARKTALFGLGNVLLRRGDPQGAQSTLLKLVTASPDDAAAWVLFGDACQQLTDGGEAARAAWSRAAALAKPDSAVAAAARQRLARGN